MSSLCCRQEVTSAEGGMTCWVPGEPKAEGSLNRFNWARPNTAMQTHTGLQGEAAHPGDLGQRVPECDSVLLCGSFGVLTV